MDEISLTEAIHFDHNDDRMLGLEDDQMSDRKIDTTNWLFSFKWHH